MSSKLPKGHTVKTDQNAQILKLILVFAFCTDFVCFVMQGLASLGLINMQTYVVLHFWNSLYMDTYECSEFSIAT